MAVPNGNLWVGPLKVNPFALGADNAMNDVESLRVKAVVLRDVLERYAAVDRNAALALMAMMQTFSDIQNGLIVPPCDNEFRWYFANTDSPLFEYADLGEAAAQYSKALELWSDE